MSFKIEMTTSWLMVQHLDTTNAFLNTLLLITIYGTTLLVLRQAELKQEHSTQLAS